MDVAAGPADAADRLMRVLVVNAGSSSLKLRLLDGDDAVLHSANLPSGRDGFDVDAVRAVTAGWPVPDVVGHRVVHGGTDFRSPVLVDGDVADRLRALTDLAPLHQPKSLAGLDTVGATLPGVPAVACFDTAFHATLPAAAYTYAVPAAWRTRWGVRRYGFHGLSHAWVAVHGPELGGDGRDPRIVSCHLGAGASLCAIRAGRSVDTTMGFTPLEGLVMATRSGTVDPGLLPWLEERARLSPREITDALEHESGLLGLCGTGDMIEVERRRAEGDPDAALAFDVYVHRLAAGVASMAAAIDGLDLLCFTGGVGEHSAPVRRAVARQLSWLGVRIDADRNASASGDTLLSPAGWPVRSVVVEAREDLQIARECRALVPPSR